MIINSMYKKPIKSTFPSDHSNKLSLNQVYHLRSMTSSRKQQLNAFFPDLFSSQKYLPGLPMPMNDCSNLSYSVGQLIKS